MTIRINLLPHRQMKRIERQRQLGVMAATTVALAIVIVFMGHSYFSSQLETQKNRNQRLQDAITELDKEIAEIKTLKDEIKGMLERKQVVENLQSGRSQVVVMLDEITRKLPESVYIKSLKQSGDTITLQGYADSNNRVAVLVRNLSDSQWLESPALVETHAEIVNNLKLSSFTLTVKQKKAVGEDATETDKGKKK